MATFKSPELQICGKIVYVFDPKGEEWKLLAGKKKFQTFQSESTESDKTYLEHPFTLLYLTTNLRGWPRFLVQVWKVDEDGRHNIYGYGTQVVPFANGHYNLQIPCWRPMGTWYDRFVGSNAELQYPAMLVSSLNRYGLRTFASCKLGVELDVLGRNFHLHGVVR